MEQPIISIKNLGKKYKIAHQQGGYVALRDVIAGAFKNPFRYVAGKAKSMAGLASKEEFWALRGVNLDVYKGDIIGVVGGNGAGKSTLLKILSQITPPTEGEVTVRGRIGSLLEVGTGFHPELTGRENIFLNGAILGMTRREMALKFDQIVEFAGVEKFLDTPVKYYSSGMYVRLAFSVAAHMETDILLIDEVLAVGDAEFQKKCLGKMEEVTTGSGRTILFVSHNMGAIQKICKKTVLMKNGSVALFGNTEHVIQHYMEKSGGDATLGFKKRGDPDAYLRRITLSDGSAPLSNIPINKPIVIETEFEVVRPVKGATISATFSTNGSVALNSYESDRTGSMSDYEPGVYTTRMEIPAFTFNVGNYDLDVSLQHPGVAFVDRVQNISLRVVDGDNPRTAIITDNVLGIMGTIPAYSTTRAK